MRHDRSCAAPECSEFDVVILVESGMPWSVLAPGAVIVFAVLTVPRFVVPDEEVVWWVVLIAGLFVTFIASILGAHVAYRFDGQSWVREVHLPRWTREATPLSRRKIVVTRIWSDGDWLYVDAKSRFLREKTLRARLRYVSGQKGEFCC